MLGPGPNSIGMDFYLDTIQKKSSRIFMQISIFGVLARGATSVAPFIESAVGQFGISKHNRFIPVLYRYSFRGI